MNYTTSQGRMYKDGNLILDTDLDRNNVKENLRIINELTNVPWKSEDNTCVKQAIYAEKGDTINYKVYKYAQRVIKMGIKLYLKGEHVVKSLLHTPQGIIPNTHVGPIPKHKGNNK